MSTDREFNRRMVRTVLTVTAVALLVATMYMARAALMLIYVSGLVAMGFAPLVRFIERPRSNRGRRRIPRVLAILAVYIAILAVVVLVGLLVIPPLLEQASTLWARLPQHFNQFQQLLIKYKLTTHRVTFQEAVQNAPAGSGGNAVTTVVAAIWGLVGGVFGLITILILSFYFLIEADSAMQYVSRFLPESSRVRVATAARQAVEKVSAWLRAQLILAGVMGFFAAVGLALFGVPYFYVVALIAAVGETIPIVGPIIAGVSAVVVAFSASPRLAIPVGGYFFVLHQLEANVLVPKIMERRVGVSPVAVIIALLIGGELWGLAGAVLAIPTAAILSVILDEVAPES